MVEAGRDIWVHLVHPEQGVQSHSQVASGDLRGGDSTASRKPVPVLGHPHSTEAYFDVETKPSVFHLVPKASCPGTGHH